MAGSGLNFDLGSFGVKARQSSGVGAAAGMVSVAEPFAAMRKKAPKYGDMATKDIYNKAQERIAMESAEADLHAQGMQSVANVKSSSMIADAQVAAAKALAAASSQGAVTGGFGSIIGTGLSLLTGGLA